MTTARITAAAGVLVADLRGAGRDEATRRMNEALTGVFQSARVLVLDDTSALVGRDVLFGPLLASRRVRSLVCVAVGPSGDRRSHATLRATAVLDNDGTATLWVGDDQGILWGAQRLDGADLTGDDADTGLEQLSRCLRIPQVFD